MLLLNRIGEILTLDGKDDQLLEFSVNQFRQTFHPRGDQYLRQFELDDIARWYYDVEGVRIVKEVQILWQRNVVGVRYTRRGRGRHASASCNCAVRQPARFSFAAVGEGVQFQG